MPVHNENRHIELCLQGVFNQNYGKNLEVIIADGMSEDGTQEIINKYKQEHPNLKLIDNPGKIVPSGMNAALRIAQGDIIIRVDGHTVIEPDYVQQCVEGLERTGADNVGGRMNAMGEGAFGEAVALSTSSPFGVGGGRFHYSDKEEWVDTVYMGAWRREVFEKIGLFDEELVRDQDDEFNYRLRENGGKILLSPKIKSQYIVRGTPGSLFKQYFQYGYWKVRVMQKHPGQMRVRQFVPPALVSSLIVSGVIALVHPVGVWLLGAIAGLYILANLSASVYTCAKKGWRHMALLPVVYAILHVSYGTGFLVGLVRFANRWGDKVGKTPAL
jgi:succinoglycan biosynthesis protein ExoA